MSGLDKALRFELNKIPELSNKIYPTHVPEGKTGPMLAYIKSSYNQRKTLEGITNNTSASYLLNVLCSSYDQLQDLTDKVKALLMTFPLKSIGPDSIYIQDMTIHNIAETYERELNLYRSIIDIQFFYREV